MVRFLLILTIFLLPMAAQSQEWLATATGLDTVRQAADLLEQAEQATRSAPLQGLIDDLQRLRGLAFEHPVPWHVKNQEGVRRFFVETMDKYYPQAQSRLDEAMLNHLGFTESGFEIRPFLEQLYTEQIGGAYDPESGEFFVVDRKKGILERLIATEDEQAAINLHELDHALGDQYFQLKTLQETALESGSTDQQLALSALLEGDATLVMFDYTMRHSGMTADDSPMSMASMADFVTRIPWFPGMGEYTGAPIYFKRALIFPYYVGMDFVREGRRTGGWTLVNHLYTDVPLSTEQILHPEKYFWDRDQPVLISMDGLPGQIEGWTSLGDDTGGEFLVSVFLEQHEARRREKASAGWGGDRFRIYEKDGASFMVWVLEWDSQEDAREFESSARRALDRDYRLIRRGTRAVLSHRMPETLRDRLEKAAFSLKASRPGPGGRP